MDRKFWKSLFVFGVALAIIFGLLPKIGPIQVSAASSGEIRAQINELQNQKGELEAQMETLEQDMRDNLTEIEDAVAQKMLIDQQIFLLHGQISNINEQISAYGVLIADQQDELDAAEERYARLNEQNRERIRAMEEDGVLSYWAVLFKANSFSDFLDRLNMIEEIAASDQRRLAELSEAAAMVAQAQAELEAEKTALETTRAELDASYAELDKKQAESTQLLADLNARGVEYETLLAESEAHKLQLLQELASMQAAYEEARYREWLATYVPPTTTVPPVPSETKKPENSSPTSGTSGEDGDSQTGATESGDSNEGSDSQTKATEPTATEPSSSGSTFDNETWLYPLPYRGVVTDPFGKRESHPIYGDTRWHYGVDLSVPSGTAIYASRSGKVTVATFDRSYGYYVQIDHGSGYRSLYAHMTNYIVSSGQYVTRGQVIGYVGSTGDSTGPHLHFAISVNGSYVNPMGYI